MVSIAVGILLLPLLYSGLLLWCRPDFEEQENRNKKPLRSPIEAGIMCVSEIAFLRIWYALGREGFGDLRFTLLYVILIGVTVLCVTDLWEFRVPNKVLLILVLLFPLFVGLYGLRDMDIVIRILPSVILGFLFCMLSFGLGYWISHGSMGAGDVKLSLVMGLYLTGEYVVGAVVYGCLTSALYSVIQLARKKVTRKDAIPFVPFLYLGLVIRYLVG